MASQGREGTRRSGICSMRGDPEDWGNPGGKCPHLKLGLRECTVEEGASELMQGGKDRWDVDREGKASSSRAQAEAQA